MRLKKDEAEFVKQSRVVRVATADSRGEPHAVPVCHVWEGGQVWFATAKTTRKVRNLQQNPQVALIFDDYTDVWKYLRGLLLQGKAEVVESGPTYRRVRKLLYAKYPQYEEMEPLEEGESVFVRVTPEKAVSWGL